MWRCLRVLTAMSGLLINKSKRVCKNAMKSELLSLWSKLIRKLLA